MTDAIDTLAAVAPGSAIDGLRRRKPVTRDGAQASYDALFAPDDWGDFPAADRVAVAAFVAGLHADAPATSFYGSRLEGERAGAIAAAVRGGAGHGPYGRYPAGVLSGEDLPGPEWRLTGPEREALGGKLAAGLEHAHALVFHPRDAEPARLRALEAAGWSADAIVTLSQLVSFLSFQIRVASGLRVLAESAA